MAEELDTGYDTLERFDKHISSHTIFQVMKVVYGTLLEEERVQFCDQAPDLPFGVNTGGAYLREDLALEECSKRERFEYFLQMSYFFDNIMDADILDIYVFRGFITYEMIMDLGEISPIIRN